MDDSLDDDAIEAMIRTKYKKVYSERLSRYVYVLVKWVDQDVFKRNKKLFGYTDIGWTIKHPRALIRALVEEGVWINEAAYLDSDEEI